jgi:exopolysaccharide biosynthesis polyprenyl glycosylphosphotransferase
MGPLLRRLAKDREGEGGRGHVVVDGLRLEASGLRLIAAEPLPRHRRGWLVRRMLVAADVTGLLLAFLASDLVAGGPSALSTAVALAFLVSLPAWIGIARAYSLYEADEERTFHATTDDLVGVFHLVSLGTWLFFGFLWLTHITDVRAVDAIAFWAIAMLLIATMRSIARGYCRTLPTYRQRTIILGAGDIGQRVARKLLRHPEYGIELLGLVDSAPKPRHQDLGDLPLLGGPRDLRDLVREQGVERVVVAFSNESDEEMLATIRSLHDLDVQVDIVPRLFELVTSSVKVDGVEGLPVVALPPVRSHRSGSALKRTLDIVLSGIALLVLAPLFAYIAIRIRRDSDGPVFFRQTRLGHNQRKFTALKFRTMRAENDDTEHRKLIERLMDADGAMDGGVLFKLEKDDRITGVGRWLRATSLDELPQLINVFRGDMSLVGPRPCIPYETEHFEPHHFDRFLVPAGITGLWQVTARARSTFREALDMDVAYARGWSLSLDLRLLCRTPWQVLARKGAA